MNKYTVAELPWVLIEGPGPGDAEFLGRWLLAAAQADQQLQKQFERNPGLKQQISRIEAVCIVSFSTAASKFTALLMKNLTCFPLSLWIEWGEIFAVMTDLGFFRRTGDRWQMTIPKRISGSKIQAALVRLAATEDEEYFLHPEHLVSCLSKPDLEKWQLRLERQPWKLRIADRNVLLED